MSKHSNIKPIEPEKPEQQIVIEEPPPKIREPVKPSTVERPAVDTPLTTLVPIVAPALKQSIDSLVVSSVKSDVTNDSTIPIGTTCKFGGCNATYESPASDDTECNYHPGVPVFHEGLKYWSCCTKRTTDFTAFMNQKGCAYGKHKWISEVCTFFYLFRLRLSTIFLYTFTAKRFHGYQVPLRLASNGHQCCHCNLCEAVSLREEHSKIESSPFGRTVSVSAARQRSVQFGY